MNSYGIAISLRTYALDGCDGEVVEEVPLSAGDLLLALMVGFPHFHGGHETAARLRLLDVAHVTMQLVVCVVIRRVVRQLLLKIAQDSRE